jgi:hypothetical protein
MNIPNCPICSSLLMKKYYINRSNDYYLNRNNEYFCFYCSQIKYFVKWSPLYWTISIKDNKIGWHTLSSINESHSYTKGQRNPIVFNYSITFQNSFVTLQKYINNQAFL